MSKSKNHGEARDVGKPVCLDDFLKVSAQEHEVRDLIEQLVLHRELMRDERLDELEAEAEKMIGKLRETKRLQLLEELECFKDILTLHKRLLRNGGRH